MPLPGVFFAAKRDGTTYYRSSITYLNQHISLGSYDQEQLAHQAYKIANELLHKKHKHKTASEIPHIEQYHVLATVLSFDKWIMLLNLRDNGIYCRNPIYLLKKYFLYYVNEATVLKFDTDDLFYYMKHRIMQRGGHLFVSDYGMQVNILSRYGIKNFAVPGRDYRFVNGDPTDFRYRNIQIINRYHGVTKSSLKGREIFTAKIHINGDFIIGRYTTEIEAAIAYNKAATIMNEKGFKKKFPRNYIEAIDEIAYAKLYSSIRLSKKIRDFPCLL